MSDDDLAAAAKGCAEYSSSNREYCTRRRWEVDHSSARYAWLSNGSDNREVGFGDEREITMGFYDGKGVPEDADPES